MRYFLNIYNAGASTDDSDGMELAGLAAAREEAIAGIRSIISDEVLGGLIDLRGRIEIVEEGKGVLMTVPFEDAVEIMHPENPGA